MLIPAIAFLVVAGIILGAYWTFVMQGEQSERAQLRRRLKAETSTQTRTHLLRAPETLSGIDPLNRLLKRFTGVFAPLKRKVDNSGLPLTVSMVILLCILTGFVVVLVVTLYTGVPWLAVVAGIASAYLPIWVLNFARAGRLRKFEEQFPEAVELIARALRAGHAFSTGIQMAADEMPKPTGPEFRLLYERQNYGAQLPDALKNFADRVPSLDARFFVTAVLTQREAGGNLSEVLDHLATVMRERFRIRREVRVKSAHGRITATVLAGMPPVLAALLFMNDPAQVRILATDPLGIRMLTAGIVLELVGILVIRRLVDIEY